MSHSYASRPSGVDTTPNGPTIRSSSARNAGLSAMACSPARRKAEETNPEVRGGRWPLLGRLLADFPGFASHEQLRDVPLTTIRNRLLFLLDDELLVRGLAFLLEERPQRDRILGRPELPEDHGGGAIGRVVLPERALWHLRHLDHLGLETLQHETAPVVCGPKGDGLAILEPALVKDLGFHVVEDIPREVVVHVAVLEN